MTEEIDHFGLARAAVELVHSRAKVQDVGALNRYNAGILTDAVSLALGRRDELSPSDQRVGVLIDHLAHFTTLLSGLSFSAIRTRPAKPQTRKFGWIE